MENNPIRLGMQATPAVNFIEPAIIGEIHVPPLQPIPLKAEITIEHISLSKLVFGNYTFRQTDPEPPSTLKASIKKNGFLGALVGIRKGSKIQLAFGRRRLIAAKAAKLKTIPVHIYSMDEESLYWLSLEDFFSQGNTTPLDEALALAQALLKCQNLAELAHRLGLELEFVQRRLTLLRYPDLEKALREGLIDAPAAYELAQIEDRSMRVRFLNQWQSTHAAPARMLIVPLELPYFTHHIEPATPAYTPKIAQDFELGYNSSSESVFEDLQLLIGKLTKQLEQTALQTLDAKPEWRKPTRKLIKSLIEELQATENLFKKA